MKIIPIPEVQHQIPIEAAMIGHFSGGVQTSRPQTSLQPDEFSEIINYYIDDQGFLESRPGFRPLGAASGSSASRASSITGTRSVD